MRPVRLALLLVAVVLGAAASSAGRDPAALPAGLAPSLAGVVAAVIDGDTVRLGDGTVVRLVGLQAPKLALGRDGFAEWPLAAEARAALAALVEGRRVRLAYGGRRIDRHGRQLAHVEREDGLWVQGAMVRDGWARVYSFPDNRTAVEALLRLEREARAAGRGIWAHPFYAVREAAEAARDPDSFQLVEGTVRDAAEVDGRVFLNFGEDWRTDFTAVIAPHDRAVFAAAGRDPLALAGRRLRVRGWLHARNGPAVDVTHPEQIELLDGGWPAASAAEPAP